MNEDITDDSALDIGDAGVERLLVGGGADVVCDLTIQVANAICTREAETGALGELDLAAFGL